MVEHELPAGSGQILDSKLEGALLHLCVVQFYLHDTVSLSDIVL